MLLRYCAIPVAALAMSAVGALPADEARAEGGYVPAGSYLDSCTGVTYNDTSKTLWAQCKEKNPVAGFPIATVPLNISNCAENSIWNDDGQLYCLAKDPWGNEHTVPPGSYIQSCSKRRVVNNVLMAECGTRSGSSIRAVLNLNDCRWGGDVSNDGGVLRCTPRVPILPTQVLDRFPTTSVKPVDAAPRPVNPVAIDPAASDAPAVEEGDRRERRRERRRNRGERG